MRKCKAQEGYYIKPQPFSEAQRSPLPVAPKTIYGWESGQTQPDADTLLILCKIYNIDNILGTFGYNDSMDNMFLSEEERTLILRYRDCPEMQNAVKKLLEMP